MPNILDRQIVEEGPRNAVVKLTGVLDTSDASEVSCIQLGDFINNDPVGIPLIGFRVDHITFAIGNGLEVQIAWNGLNPQQIAPLAGRGKIDSTDDGGFIPDMTREGYDGSINLTTTGYQPNSVQNFTVFLRLVKLYGA